MEIKVKVLNENAVMPKYQTEFSAGCDLCSCQEQLVKAGETVLIKTGLAMEIPAGFGGFIFARSGLATKRGLAPANKVGVVDSDYRGEIMVALHNHGKVDQLVEKGERVAQLVFMPISQGQFVIAEEISQTVRGEGGFGSTGKK